MEVTGVPAFFLGTLLAAGALLAYEAVRTARFPGGGTARSKLAALVLGSGTSWGMLGIWLWLPASPSGPSNLALIDTYFLVGILLLATSVALAPARGSRPIPVPGCGAERAL